MTTRRWRREGRSDLASDRILDAAAEVFVRQGVAQTSMGDVAREAGCSRATLYRYFDDRPALRRAFVHRETRRLAAEVAAEIAGVDDDTDRVVEAVMLCVSKVRARPTLHAWFATDNVGITRDLIASSEVIEGVAAAFLGRSGDPQEAEWMVRTVVSLVVLPGADTNSERSMLRRFVAPTLGSWSGNRGLRSELS